MANRKTSRTKFVILGMLNMAPMSGYKISSIVKTSIDFFWTESHSKIYPELAKLEKQGLVEKSVQIQTGKPNKHIYNITDKGRDELDNWIKEPYISFPFKSELLLKVWFGSQYPVEYSLLNIYRFQKELEKKMKSFKEIEEHLEKVHKNNENWIFWHSSLRKGILMNEAQQQWCTETIARLKEIKKTNGIDSKKQ